MATTSWSYFFEQREFISLKLQLGERVRELLNPTKFLLQKKDDRYLWYSVNGKIEHWFIWDNEKVDDLCCSEDISKECAYLYALAIKLKLLTVPSCSFVPHTTWRLVNEGWEVWIRYGVQKGAHVLQVRTRYSKITIPTSTLENRYLRDIVGVPDLLKILISGQSRRGLNEKNVWFEELKKIKPLSIGNEG